MISMKRMVLFSGVLVVLAVCGVFYYEYSLNHECTLERSRFELLLKDTTRIQSVVGLARAEARNVEAGRSPVITIDKDDLLKYLPVNGCLGVAGVHGAFPWSQLGLKSGIIRVFQLQKIPDGTFKWRRHFVRGDGVDAVFVGDPYRWGIIVITSDSLGPKCKELLGRPNVHWSGDYGIWLYKGHQR